MVATSKPVILMLMIISFASAGFAILLSLSTGSSGTLIVTIPGFVVGAFFAFKYALYDRNKRKEEEHKKSRNRHKH